MSHLQLNTQVLWTAAGALLLFGATTHADVDGQDTMAPPPGRLPAIQLSPQPIASESANIGKTIPQTRIIDSRGEVRWLFRDSAALGTVVVVRDPHCPVSSRYGPRISSMARHYRSLGYGFVFIYPAMDLQREERLSDQERLNVPGVYVARGSFALAERLGVRSTGDVFLLDADHRLRYRGAIDDQFGIGYIRDFPTRHYLRDALDAWASGEAIRQNATVAPGCHIDADPGNDWIVFPAVNGQLAA